MDESPAPGWGQGQGAQNSSPGAGGSRSGANGAPRPPFPPPWPLPGLPALPSPAPFQPRSCPLPVPSCPPSPHLRVFDVAVHGSLVQPVDRLARPGEAAPVHAGPLLHFRGVRGPLGASQSPWGTKRQPRAPRARPRPSSFWGETEGIPAFPNARLCKPHGLGARESAFPAASRNSGSQRRERLWWPPHMPRSPSSPLPLAIPSPR